MFKQLDRIITSRKQKYLGALAVTVLSVIFIGVFVNWSTSLNKGEVRGAKDRPAEQIPGIKFYDGKLISFNHEGIYSVQQLNPQDGDLELSLLEAATNYRKRIAVAVSLLPQGKLENNSAYKLRKTDTTNYIMRGESVVASDAIIFNKKDGSELTVFMPRGDRVAMLSFSTAGAADDLVQEASTLLATFEWKADRR